MSIESVIGTILGGPISLAVSHWYYRKAGRELRDEAKELRTLTELMMYILLNPGADIEWKKDRDGKVVGLFVKAVGRG